MKRYAAKMMSVMMYMCDMCMVSRAHSAHRLPTDASIGVHA
jgi:hypothetical protein